MSPRACHMSPRECHMSPCHVLDSIAVFRGTVQVQGHSGNLPPATSNLIFFGIYVSGHRHKRLWLAHLPGVGSEPKLHQYEYQECNALELLTTIPPTCCGKHS